MEAIENIIAKRIVKKVDWLLNNFDQIVPEKLSSNLAGLYKLRVGDYRVVYSFHEEDNQIIIEWVGHRRDVYNK